MSKQKKGNRLMDIIYYVAMILLLLWFAYSKGWIFTNFDSIKPKDAIMLMKTDDNITLLDVRTIKEYKQAHLPNATLIPLDKLKNNLNKLPKNKKILVYCRSGNRSISASRILKNSGRTPVNIEQGIVGLIKEGAEIIK